MTFKPRLLSTAVAERMMAVARIETEEYIEPKTHEVSSWMAFYTALMPITDWLLRGIYPLLRVEFMNNAMPKKFSDYPSLNLSKEVLASGMYKRGIGRNTVVGAQFPAYHIPATDYSQLSNKSSASSATYARQLKSGDYQATATVGNGLFLYNHYKNVNDNSVNDAFEITKAWDLEGTVALTKDPAHRKAWLKVFGEDFFDLQKPYQKTFAMKKEFTEYLKLATGVEPYDLVLGLIDELGLSAWANGEILAEDDPDEIQYVIDKYLNWLDLNIRTYDIISAPQTPSGFPTQREPNNSSKRLEITSLKDPNLATSVMPDSVQMQTRSLDGYTAFDFFVDSVVSCRDTTAHVMIDLPKDVARWVTQSTGKEVDNYYLIQILNQAQFELQDFDTYKTSSLPATVVGGQSAGYYGFSPVESTIKQLEGRKVNALGVNKDGLGVNDVGQFIYVPPKLNNMGAHRKQIEEYFEQLQLNNGSKFFALRDPFDILGNTRVIGKEMKERPRPEHVAIKVKPLYADWGLGVLLGVNSEGSVTQLLDLKHVTPLRDTHYKNYARAALYPVIVRDNGRWTKSFSDILTATKPNQYNAVTGPLKHVIDSFLTRAVSKDDMTAWAMADAREIFQTRKIEGLDIEISDENSIEGIGRLAGASINANDPLGSLAGYVHQQYARSHQRLLSIFGDDESIPAEYDDIANIATNGFGDYFKLESLAKDWTRSPSLYTRLFGRILTNIWAAVDGRLDIFYDATSVELAHRYYGTIKAVVDLMKNPRSIALKYNNTAVAAPEGYVPEPLAGSREGYAMLPHQVRVDYHATKMMVDDIEFEVLDAQAGAGKTHNILMDVMRRLDAKSIKRPLVICPDYLIKNYIEDGAYIYQGRLNVVPLVTLVKNYDPLFGVKSDPMGLEGMLRMVESAPPNTLFVTSYSFLSSGSQSAFTIPMGMQLVTVNPHLEMMLEAGFDYVCADEFHELRNMGTTKSDVAKAIFYRAKYRKGATGTFLNTSPSDIPAQTSMLDPTIFGSPNDFFEYYADNDGAKTSRISKLREGRKEDLVVTLKSSTGYTQVKRKEWASLLPERKDSYHVLELDENSVQWKIYQAILQQVLEEIARILEKNKELAKDANSGDEEANENLEALLRPYLQRLEMLLITPALDKDYEKLVEGMDLDYDENYVSPAVERAIKIIEAHLYGVKFNTEDLGERQAIVDEHADFLDLENVGDIDQLIGLPPTPGKILVFCNYNTSVQAVYNALPPALKEQAILYDAKNKDKHIFEFKNNPKKTIMIGIQTSLATGHNFQFCTRLIRLEQVWSPGEVEQGESRINRPDPKNKDNVRSKIFYDWVVIDGTIQVTKLARLISRMIVNTEIEEFGNPAYKDVPYMSILVMNLATIRNNCWFHAPSDVQAGTVTTRSLLKYLETKRTIDSIQKREYAEWIKNYTGPIDPVEVTPKAPIEGSAVVVNVPPIPGQTIANADVFNVVNVAKYETLVGSQDVDLVGMKCLTPEGDGEIARMSGSKLHVIIDGTKYSFDRLSVNLYLNEGVSRADLLKLSGLKKFVNVEGASVSLGKSLSKKSKKNPDEMSDDELLTELEIPKTSKRKKETLVSLDDMYSQSVDFLKSKAKDNMPKVVKTKKPVPSPTDSETGEPDQEIEVYASNTNGALCLMLSSEDADLSNRKMTRLLSNMGYHLDPDCWYATITNKKMLQDLIDKFESKFDIPEKTLDMLYSMLEAFTVGRKRMLNADHASVAEIKEYWLQDNRRTMRKDPNALIPMPVVQDGELYIMLDMEHPASKRAKRLRIPNVTWESSGGLWMKMYSSKKACATDLIELQKYFTISDKDDLKADIKAINIRGASTK